MRRTIGGISLRSYAVVMALSATQWLTACGAMGPAYESVRNVPEDKGLVYVYRYDRFTLGGRTAKFYLNDVPAFDLDRNGYSWMTLSPGTYHLEQRWGQAWMGPDMDPARMILTVEAGETVYVSFDTNRCPAEYGMICFGWKLKRMSSYVGPREIADKKFQENFGLPEINAKVRPE